MQRILLFVFGNSSLTTLDSNLIGETRRLPSVGTFTHLKSGDIVRPGPDHETTYGQGMTWIHEYIAVV